MNFQDALNLVKNKYGLNPTDLYYATLSLDQHNLNDYSNINQKAAAEAALLSNHNGSYALQWLSHYKDPIALDIQRNKAINGDTSAQNYLLDIKDPVYLKDIVPSKSHISSEEEKKLIHIAKDKTTAAEIKEALKASNPIQDAMAIQGFHPDDISQEDVIARLRGLGIPNNQMRDAIDAYLYSRDYQSLHPDANSEDIRNSLIADHEEHPEFVERLTPFLPQIDKFVKSDLGTANPAEAFSDPISRRNFLKANHFPESQIKEIERTVELNRELPAKTVEKLWSHEVKRRQEVLASRKQQKEKARTVLSNIQDMTPESAGNEPSKAHAQAVQGALNLAAIHANTPRERYKGKVFADTDPYEKTAEDLLLASNPNLSTNSAHLKDIDTHVKSHLGRKYNQTLSEPHLNKSSESLLDIMRRYEDEDDVHGKKMIDKTLQSYLEKTAPNIRDRMLTPGVRHHGHIEKRQNDALREIAEGLGYALTDRSLQRKSQNMQGALAEKQHELNLANAKTGLNQQDITNDIALTNELEKHRQNTRKERQEYTTHLGALGEEKRKKEQEKLDHERAEWDKDTNKLEKDIRLISDITHGNPISSPLPEHNIQRPTKIANSGFGSAVTGLGAALFKKEGGIVNKYVTRKASLDYLKAKQHYKNGGEVNDLIQDAVMDGDSISSEIARQNRRKVFSAAKNNYDAARKNLATGGIVNPIASGANMAKDFVQKDKDLKEQENLFREKLINSRFSSIQNEPEEEPSLIKKAITGFMRGAAAGNPEHWLGKTGAAFMTVHNAKEAEKELKRKKQKDNYKQLNQVAKQYADEQYHEKNLNLHHKKLDQESALEREKLAAIMKHHGAQESHWKAIESAAQAKSPYGPGFTPEGMDINDLPTKPLTEKDKQALDKAGTVINSIDDAITHLDALGDVVNTEKTGPGLGAVGTVLGPFSSLVPGVGSQTTVTGLSRLQKRVESAYSAFQHLERVLGEIGGRNLASVAKAEQNSFPSLSADMGENARIVGALKKKLLNTAASYKKVLERHGASPNEIKAVEDRISKITETLNKPMESGKSTEISNLTPEEAAELAELEREEKHHINKFKGGTIRRSAA